MILPFFVTSVSFCKISEKFVSIRVHSWFLFLAAAPYYNPSKFSLAAQILIR
jgi:hypothetical protein